MFRRSCNDSDPVAEFGRVSERHDDRREGLIGSVDALEDPLYDPAEIVVGAVP